MLDFDTVVDEAVAMQLSDPGDQRWQTALPRLLAGAQPADFVAWAEAHPKWQFNVADVRDGVCAKPVEAAIAILADIVAERLEAVDE